MKVDLEMCMKAKDWTTIFPTEKTTFVPGCMPFYTKVHVFWGEPANSVNIRGLVSGFSYELRKTQPVVRPYTALAGARPVSKIEDWERREMTEGDLHEKIQDNPARFCQTLGGEHGSWLASFCGKGERAAIWAPRSGVFRR